MKPIKLSIKADAQDHYIYRGKLYIILSDGGLVSVSLYEIFEKLTQKYKDNGEISGILNMAFRCNLYWRTQPVRSFLSIPEIKEGMLKAWKRITESTCLEVSLEKLNYDTVISEIPSDILDLNIYGNSIFLGCIDGFFQFSLDYDQRHRKCKKKFDAKTYALSTGYSSVILSLGSEGLSKYNPFNEKRVRDKNVLETHSLRSHWTPAGSMMNYMDSVRQQFISNTISKNETAAEDRFFISGFGNSITDIDFYIRENSKEAIENSRFLFNGNKKQYSLTRKGELFAGNLSVRDGKLSSLEFKKETDINLNKYGLPITGKEVASFPVIEFEDSVCLIQNGEIFCLEDEGPVSIHSYPSSTHFRDILSVTAENYINLYSIDVISAPDIHLHPRTNYRNRHSFDTELFENSINLDINNITREFLSDSELPF